MSPEPFKILVAERYDEAALTRLRQVGTVVVMENPGPQDLRQAVADCDALLVRTYTQVTQEVLAAGNQLKVVGRGGVGVENIDVPAARSMGIKVVYTPGAATEAVADLAVGLMIALVRDLRRADQAVRSGQFARFRADASGDELGDLTVGIVGMGRTGSAFGRRCCLGLGMRVLFNDIVEPAPLDFAATSASKATLFSRSDIVSLHVPLTKKTTGLINDESLALFKVGSWLINTSRGRVVDSTALASALSGGRLSGVALDVTDPEPLPEGHPLLLSDRVIFTPHIGARTGKAMSRMGDVVDDVIRVLQGRPPLHPA